jgi:hypothetical protein
MIGINAFLTELRKGDSCVNGSDLRFLDMTFAVIRRLLRLGRVDKLSDPQSDGCNEDEAEKAIGGLVVSRRQPPTVFQL